MGERWGSPLLLAEAIAQAALLLEGGDPESGRRGFLAGIEGFEARRPPRAGRDALRGRPPLGALRSDRAVRRRGDVRAGRRSRAAVSLVRRGEPPRRRPIAMKIADQEGPRAHGPARRGLAEGRRHGAVRSPRAAIASRGSARARWCSTSRALDYMDSTGVGVLVGALKRFTRRASARFSWPRRSGASSTGLRVTHLDTLFRIYDTLDPRSPRSPRRPTRSRRGSTSVSTEVAAQAIACTGEPPHRFAIAERARVAGGILVTVRARGRALSAARRSS